MRVRRTLAAALAVMFALVATGCAEGPEPKFAEPTTASPTDEPTETESEEPEAESPEEFIRRWQAAALDAQVTGDTAEYRAMSSKCRSCRDFAGQVDRVYEGGGSIELADLEVLRVTPDVDDPLAFMLLRRLGSTRVLSASGEVEQEFPGGKERLRVFLGKRGDTWSVVNVLRTSQ